MGLGKLFWIVYVSILTLILGMLFLLAEVYLTTKNPIALISIGLFTWIGLMIAYTPWKKWPH